MNKKAWEIRNSDVARALEMSQSAYDLASLHEYPTGKAYSLRNLSRCHSVNSNYEVALLRGLEGLALFESLQDLKGQAEVVNILSQIQWELGDYSEALTYALEYLNLTQKMGDRASEAQALNNSAMVYARLNDFANALQMLSQALPIFRECDNQRGQAFALNNIAMLHYDMGNHEEALQYGQESLQIADTTGMVIYKVAALDTLGQIYTGMGEYEQALSYLQQAYDMAQAQELKRDQLYALLNMGKIYQKQEASDLALSYVQRALNLAQELETKQAIFECHQILAQIYQERGQFEPAFAHHQLFHRINKEVFNENSDKQRKKLEVRHRTESARKEAQLLRLKNKELEREISERKRVVAALRQAKKEAEEAKVVAEVASQAKSEFLSNMSHELRTPLNAILGFAQVMTRTQTLPDEHQEYVGIITRSAEHLLTLINNVLDLSKIEAGRVSLNQKNFDLYRLLDDLEDMFLLKAEEKRLQLLFERTEQLPQYMYTDEVKLRQVLINLLNNAIKFTEEGGVSVRVKMIAHNKLYVEVEDSGPGIAPEELDLIFSAFAQSETGRQSQEGTGLGLPISRQFVRLMSGEMRVESQVGRGTLFGFGVEVQVVGESEIEQHFKRRVIALEPKQPRYRILIVDDKQNNRHILIKLLAALGFDLREASNGQEAIDIWQAWEPHLIWMDMRMPIMNGYEATRQIKKSHKGQTTAIIALTASAYEEERAVVLAAGCDDFLRKPFREADIFDLMNKHIGVRYVYEEAAKPLKPRQEALRAAALATLPNTLLDALEDATTRVDMFQIEQLIDQIRTHDAQMANQLTALTDEFDYGKILDLIEETKK